MARLTLVVFVAALAALAALASPASGNTASAVNPFQDLTQLADLVEPSRLTEFLEFAARLREEEPAAGGLGLGLGLDQAQLHAHQALYEKGLVQWVRSKGYPCEEHTVTTEDGYVLTLHRIPHGSGSLDNSTSQARPVVLLQHGLIDSSYTWVVNDKHNSLAFLLADSGFDVWMGNSRGNAYSRGHKYLDADRDSLFWSFSFHEFATYDLPAVIDGILATSGQNDLAYVGHSQGCAIGMIAFSQNLELAAKVRSFVALAPVTYVSNSKATVLKLLSFLRTERLFQLLGVGNFVPQVLSKKAHFLCWAAPSVCEHLTCSMTGCDIMHELDRAALVRLFGEFPSSTSLQNLAHWLQNFRSGEFRAYDHGSVAENLLHYGSVQAPLYDLSKLAVPMHVFSGDKDILGTPTDTKRMIQDLPDATNWSWKAMKRYGHASFVWGLDAPINLYPLVVSIVTPQN